MYGKQTECAIAVMSRLAAAYDGGKTHLSAAEIARSCGMNPTAVMRVLAVLTRWGLLTRTRGPGGGSVLARDPKAIKLYDVFRLFEIVEGEAHCPIRDARGGGDFMCPLHRRFLPVRKVLDDLLHETTFEVFRAPSKADWRPPDIPKVRRTARCRKSYRAPSSKTSKTMMFHCLMAP